MSEGGHYLRLFYLHNSLNITLANPVDLSTALFDQLQIQIKWPGLVDSALAGSVGSWVNQYCMKVSFWKLNFVEKLNYLHVTTSVAWVLKPQVQKRSAKR